MKSPIVTHSKSSRTDCLHTASVIYVSWLSRANSRHGLVVVSRLCSFSSVVQCLVSCRRRRPTWTFSQSARRSSHTGAGASRCATSSVCVCAVSRLPLSAPPWKHWSGLGSAAAVRWLATCASSTSARRTWSPWTPWPAGIWPGTITLCSLRHCRLWTKPTDTTNLTGSVSQAAHHTAIFRSRRAAVKCLVTRAADRLKF